MKNLGNEAGLISASDYQEAKNRREAIRLQAELVRLNIMTATGLMSDCCGTAIIKNKDGEDICADCLEACDAVKI